jgi:hypothetical protein
MGIMCDSPLCGALAGISKLSQLEIDADKNWEGKGIIDIKEVVASMTKGDLLFRSDDVIAKLSPGSTGSMLTTGGPGADPSWGY